MPSPFSIDTGLSNSRPTESYLKARVILVQHYERNVVIIIDNIYFAKESTLLGIDGDSESATNEDSTSLKMHSSKNQKMVFARISQVTNKITLSEPFYIS